MTTRRLTGGFLNETHISGKENSRNILFVRSGMATQTQIEEGIKAAIITANKQLRNKLGVKFEINVVIDKEGKLIGHSYVHVSDTKLANVLRGFNPDGTTRKETIVPSFEDEMNAVSTGCWADDVEENDSKTIETHQSLYTPIRIIYSPTQSASAALKGWETEGYTLIIGWAEIKTFQTLSNEGHLHNILTGKIPKDISNTIIHQMFDQFNTSENTFRRGHEPAQSYPVIERRGDDVDITYDNKTNDAQCAFQMRKKCWCENTALFFGHKQVSRCSRNGGNDYRPRSNQHSYSRQTYKFQENLRGSRY